METPEPMLTRISGNSGSGHGNGRVSPFSPTVKRSAATPSLPPVLPTSAWCPASSSNPSTTAESSFTGSISTRRASRKSGANLHAPPPAVAILRKGRKVLVKISPDQSEMARSNLMSSSLTGSPSSLLAALPFSSETQSSGEGAGESLRLRHRPDSKDMVPWFRHCPRCCTACSICEVDPETKRTTKLSPPENQLSSSRW
mmetsp:Transcript_4321/g.11120  ORF Transcript_4321/g.11120 Transcript_4321/m.11120 type:complete len:200 (+) Transcript_4321:702-1301(+)